jgi:hypothetical protein
MKLISETLKVINIVASNLEELLFAYNKCL